MVLGIFKTERIDVSKQYIKAVFKAFRNYFNIIGNDSCEAHVHARLYYQRLNQVQLSGCIKWVTIYEKPSYHHLPRSRQRNVTNEARPNTEKRSRDMLAYMSKSQDMDDCNSYVFRHIDMLTADERVPSLIDFICLTQTIAFNFRTCDRT